MGRAKSIESLAEKVGRKRYSMPLAELTDLCGVRVIVHLVKQALALGQAVRATFEVDVENSENKAARLAVSSFGYLSDHYILVLESFPPVDGFDERDKLEQLETLRRDVLALGAPLRAELQIRTIAQHIWADIYHELGYKSEFQLPQRWEREFARLAALLEHCDKGFQDVADAMVGTYASSYGAFMDEAQLLRLAHVLETVLRSVPSEKGLAKTVHRLIKTYLALGDREGIASLLREHAGLLDTYPPALRDVGVAFCQASSSEDADFERGQALLRRAIELSPQDVDALCSLAGSHRRRGQRAEALALYRKAHRLEPGNPYPLGNYIAEELLAKRDVSLLEYFHPMLQEAIGRCQQQIAVRVNLPWAYFDIGLFQLYLGDPDFLSLHHYARGVAAATRDWMVRTAFQTLDSLRSNGIVLPTLDLSTRLLDLGWWLKGRAHREGPGADAVFPPAPPPYERLGYESTKGPVILLTGGCDGLGPQYLPRLAMLRRALAAFPGTLVSGGTLSGIPNLVGELQAAHPQTISSVGYLPHGQRSIEDRRYERLRYSDATDFSPLEPLRFYEDWVASGRSPEELGLLGFNGGRIAAVEYRLALALGVTVGIVAESGRAADELLQDPNWQGFSNLKVLQTEEQIREFLRSLVDRVALSGEVSHA